MAHLRHPTPQHLPRDFVVIASSEQAVSRWLRLLPQAATWALVSRIGLIARQAAAARCVIVDVPDLETWSGLREIREIAVDPVFKPLVVITDQDANNARLLADVTCYEILWTTEPATKVVRTITMAHCGADLAQAVQRSGQTHAVVREIVKATLTASPPIVSVEQLARSIGLNRRTLWKHWTGHFNSDEMTMGDFLRWFLFLRALPIKQAGASWSAAARAVGVHEDTVLRIGRRFLDRAPSDLAGVEFSTLVERFKARIRMARIDTLPQT